LETVAPTQPKTSKKTTTTKAKAPAKAAAKAAAKAPAKAPAKETAPKARAPQRKAEPPTHEAIATRAYELSLADSTGDQMSHWLQAERELTTES
jgi:hypothetical protein